MQTKITIDDKLYEQALEMAEPGMDKSELFRVAIETFVRVQAAKRLAALGTAQPDMQEVPRRRSRPQGK
ncbi:VapB protein of antitoxin of type II toxin-antitoxin system [Pseudacidovorax intermedius]|uniref:VapB protein of antitoxin of type II toxin-antitoxin system n=1 Tax=Pseudacidovorax intermedius TaxID=433924 RepID=A0A370FPG7_9BURK|nr:type II toxin-antitoxin system VapB family antitoxin [Pseudacidovorax intermedius]RDI29163.1 VapB protein of antitoxin of type II toxin-antitoxin system [Pseudacidovorax intermedius]